MYKLTRHTNIDLHALFESSIRLLIQRMGAGLIVFLALGLTLGLTGPAQAQSAETTRVAHADVASTAPPPATDGPSARGFSVTSATWRAHFDRQAARVLREHSPRTANKMMQNVIVVATEGSESIDLTMVLPELLRIIEEDACEARRLMALQALDAVGTEHARDLFYQRAMQRLYRIAQEEVSAHVRGVSATVIKDFQENNE